MQPIELKIVTSAAARSGRKLMAWRSPRAHGAGCYTILTWTRRTNEQLGDLPQGQPGVVSLVLRRRPDFGADAARRRFRRGLVQPDAQIMAQEIAIAEQYGMPSWWAIRPARWAGARFALGHDLCRLLIPSPRSARTPG
jgi:hypothetical protein